MPLLESPRDLVGKDKDEEAVRVVHELARINGKTSYLTVEQLLVFGSKNMKDSEGGGVPGKGKFWYVSDAVRHFKGLFATKRVALSSILVFLITCTCVLCYLLNFFCGITTLFFAVQVGIGLSLYYMFLPYM
jgi:hypothetical protein